MITTRRRRSFRPARVDDNFMDPARSRQVYTKVLQPIIILQYYIMVDIIYRSYGTKGARRSRRVMFSAAARRSVASPSRSAGHAAPYTRDTVYARTTPQTIRRPPGDGGGGAGSLPWPSSVRITILTRTTTRAEEKEEKKYRVIRFTRIPPPPPPPHSCQRRFPRMGNITRARFVRVQNTTIIFCNIVIIVSTTARDITNTHDVVITFQVGT